MHYIRLLRPPSVSATRRRTSSLALLFTITTDLGDSFLLPEEPVDVVIKLASTLESGEPTSVCLTKPASSTLHQWRPGMRVVKVDLDLPDEAVRLLRTGRVATVSIEPENEEYSSLRIGNILPRGSDHSTNDRGLIMGLVVRLDFEAGGEHASFRKLHLGQRHDTLPPNGALYLDVEEEIGESIARHVWDAGVLTASLLSRICENSAALDDLGSIPPLMQVLCKEGSLNILELGCGVGILGLSLAAILNSGRSPRVGRGNHILLTDLPEAEERARGNIAHAEYKGNKIATAASTTSVGYENLDWEDGREGRFPSAVQSRAWDLVMLSDCTYNVDMLPALVGTLSALHEANAAQGPKLPKFRTRVLLATKPRHASEKALFGFLANADWSILSSRTLPLPVLGGPPQAVEVYVFEKA